MRIIRRGIPFIIAIGFITAFRGAMGSPNQSNPHLLMKVWKLIAREYASQNADPSFFDIAPRWIYPAQAIPVGVIPANAPERTVVFGTDVSIFFQNLNTAYPLKLELTFLSDSSDRAVRVLAGDTVLQERLAIPFGVVMRKSWIIPAGAIVKGRLEVHVERMSGPNAALCGFRLYSSNPNESRIHPVSIRITPLYIPHIIEEPSYARGISRLRLSLNGRWNFKPDATDNGKWSMIQVPGEWEMEGFTVPPDHEAEYQRDFHAPTQWERGRVILKCAGVYSEARIFVNGRYAGMHIGGFTQFEIDISSLLHYGGDNRISLYVKSTSLADRLASGMQYAAHDLGGITRDIHLDVTPKVFLEDAHIVTCFDKSYRNAHLLVGVTVVHKLKASVQGLSVQYLLRTPSGGVTPLSASNKSIPLMQHDGSLLIRANFWVKSPMKWDPEHPNLYVLSISILAKNKVMEQVAIPFGFRQIEVRGNRIFVNNHPIKLRGVCRHETDPLRGRSLSPGMDEKDVVLFRVANVNVIRTSHYPPSKEFIQACDKLGMFVEEEAPFCWANPTDSRDAAYVSQAEMEMALRDRNDPCVLQWSLGNESPWSTAFEAGYLALRTLDATRPCLFDGGGEPSPPLDIDAPHYPGLDAQASYAHAPRPVFIGEESHLECYNRDELMTDPGLRDIWEMGFSQMWENMYHSSGCEGGDIWAGIDDDFFLPSGKIVGYGPWGIIDEWRRPKPEYWEVKKVYSPIRVTVNAYHKDQELILNVQNRELFTNLSELRFIWSLGDHNGSAHCTASPGHSGILHIPIHFPIRQGESLFLKIYSPLHYLVDIYAYPLGGKTVAAIPHFPSKPLQVREENGVYTVMGNGFDVEVRADTGQITRILSGKTEVAIGGPALMLEPKSGEGFGQITDSGENITPFNRLWTGWKAQSVSMESTTKGVAFHVKGECNEAQGTYSLTITSEGGLKFQSDFVSRGSVDLWQEGWVIETPISCDKLTWNRKARWSFYPEDHIGRPVGYALAHDGKPMTGPFGPIMKPSWSWAQDDTPWGTNDFRSTKRNVLTASLSAPNGTGMELMNDGKQDVRCWVNHHSIDMYLMDYGNEGTAPLFNQRMIPELRLHPGSKIRDAFTLQILP